MKKRKKYSLFPGKARSYLLWIIIVVAALIGAYILNPRIFRLGQSPLGGVESVNAVFDNFGYNEKARIFNGAADGVDRVLDQAVWGDPTYAYDRLVMKWNAEWDRGNDERWSKPPYNAWIDNEWNGKVKNGSNETWHYKIVWVGPCGATGTAVTGGGYCIWGQFAVILSQGTFGKQHIWDVLANPAGFGAY